MTRALLFCFAFFFCFSGFAQTASQPASFVSSANVPVSARTAVVPSAGSAILPGSSVYVAPMGGYERFIIAALEEKRVPVVVLSDPSISNFEIRDVAVNPAGWAKAASSGSANWSEQANITVTDLKTHAVVFSFAVKESNSSHGNKSSAEDCAKHLRELMESK